MTSDDQEAVRTGLDSYSDNFDRLITNPLTDILLVPGHHQFTPERQRVYRDGSRVFLEYGSDSGFTNTDAGVTLSPAAGETLSINTTSRVPYPVGYDVLASMAIEVSQEPASGDVVAGGFGDPDVANFDPETETYSGSSADGYFFYVTSDTGFNEVLLAMVRDGSILDSVRASLTEPMDVWKRLELALNWYDVGPCLFRETYTDVAGGRTDPQYNDLLSAVANDNGKGPLHGTKRLQVQCHQASGNSGLTAEVGSLAAQVPGRYDPLFKTKDHTMNVSVSNTVDETYEVVGALTTDPDQPLIEGQIIDIEVSNTPSSGAKAEVLVITIDPSETNYSDSDFSVPPEHSNQNSIIEQAVGDTGGGSAPTGPDADAAGTDSTGAATATTMTNPGGYQVGRSKINQTGSGNTNQTGKNKDRIVPDTDYALVLVDADTSGTYEIEFATRQNA